MQPGTLLAWWDCPLSKTQDYCAEIPLTIEMLSHPESMDFCRQSAAYLMKRGGCSQEAIEKAIQQEPVLWLVDDGPKSGYQRYKPE